MINVALEEITVNVEEQKVTINVKSGAGPQGLSGTVDSYEFTQPTPSSLWIINHNRGKQLVNVSIMDQANQMVEGEIEYVSVNQCRIKFNPAMAGSARIV